MKTKTVNLVLGTVYVLFITTLILLLGVTKSFAQNIFDEPCVAFRYDGFENPEDAPASITLERLAQDEIDIKTYNHEKLLPNGIGLPSIEDVKKNIIKSLYLFKDETRLMRDDTRDDNTARLIKEESDDDSAHLIKDDTKDTAHLIREDWDGAHSA